MNMHRSLPALVFTQKMFGLANLIVTALLVSAHSVSAADEYWVGASGTVNNPSSGIWSNGTATVWNNGIGSAGNCTWTNGSSAFFGGVDGIYSIKVKAGSAINVSNITFLNSGYTLTNDTPQTIALGGTSTAVPKLAIAVGKTATIGTNITVSTSNTSYLGNAGNTPGGTLIIENGGSLVLTTANTLALDGAGSVISIKMGGILSHAGGSSSQLAIGVNNTGNAPTVSVDGGTIDISGINKAINVGNGTGPVAGILTLNGGSVNMPAGTTKAMTLGVNAGNAGTLNLNGGVLNVAQIMKGNGPAFATNNFNGGTLKVVNATFASSFLSGLDCANVRNGGLVFDDSGFSITIGQQLQHSTISGDNAIDGGLTYLGGGTLMLTNVNTYTGPTTVSEGTLALSGSIRGPVTISQFGTLTAGNAVGSISISNTLNLNGTVILRLDRSSGTNCDFVQGVTTLSFGGTLIINLVGGTVAAGDVFTLFKAGSFSGSFNQIIVPALTNNLLFDTSHVATDGTLRVILNNSAPVFSSGIAPASTTALVGDSITFTTTVTGAVPIGYQWRCNGTNIPGATSGASLTLVNLVTNNSGSYTLVASNALGKATNSLSASLTVRPVDDFDTLRWAWRDFNTLPTNANLSDPVISNYVVNVGNTANAYWSSMNKTANRTYLWSNAASTNDSSDITTCYGRLNKMARGWGTRGSSVYTNATLAADIISALDWMYNNRYNPTRSEYDNWWDWEIGGPNDLNTAMCILWPLLSGTQIANYCNAIDHFSPTVNLTADNRVWKAEVVGVRGVVGRNATKVAAARDGLSDVSGGGANNVFAFVAIDDGFYRDGGFIQHHKQPYTGGYGISLLGDASKIAQWLKPSQWAITDPLQTNMVQWCYNSFQPLIYYGAIPGFVQGRGISRYDISDFSAGHGAINGMLRESQSASPSDAAILKSMVKYWAQVDPTGNPINYVDIDLVPVVEQLLADPSVIPRGELIGHYRFPSLDRVMHLRPGFGFGISMFSQRIVTYESINGENYHGWFTTYGMSYYYTTNDLLQFFDNYWPTIDPYHLPGTTVDLTTLTNSQNQAVTNQQTWVGGCSLSNTFGVTGMLLQDVNTSLTARKSWFMFDDEIVCLGAGITDGSATNVHTVVENRRLNSAGNNAFTVNGNAMPATLGWTSNLTGVSWCALDSSGGYYFPNGANVTALRQARTGKWSDIDAGGTTTSYTRNYLSLIWDHGVKPTNATYAYVLLPNYTATSISNYALNPEIIILTNTPVMQAVGETTLNILAANFWTNGSQTVGILTASNQCSVICRQTNGVLEIDASDPTQTNTATITLSVNYSCTGVLNADAGVTVLQTNPVVKLSVSVNGAYGKSFQTRLSTSMNSSLLFGGGSSGTNSTTLTETWNGTNLLLNWTNGGLLLQTTNLNSPWITNVGATPPFNVIPSAPQMFYRVKLVQ
jgi:hyaluronate lyase